MILKAFKRKNNQGLKNSIKITPTTGHFVPKSFCNNIKSGNVHILLFKN